MQIELALVPTVGLAIIVILVGKFLVKKIEILQRFLIPYPVVGGLVFATIALLGHITGTFEVTFDTTIQTYFMTLFFTTVGFAGSIKVLKQGGLGVILFLVVATIGVIFQNVIGVGVATAMGADPLFGLATGSIPMTGGHGTAGAFGPLMEEAGLTGATSVALAAATFGLIAGSLIGGPTAKSLIKKYNLKPKTEASNSENSAETKTIRELDPETLSLAFFQIALAAGIGYYISLLITNAGFVVPGYIGGMLVAVLMRNVFKDGSKLEMKLPEIDALGSIFLAVFLAHALMGLRLWELAELAVPLIVLLTLQVAFMALYARFVTFNVMGRDYDAAVISAGHCGFGLGATPNAIANMNAVTNKYGPSPAAFFILPMVGAMFIDIVNASVITMFVQFFS